MFNPKQTKILFILGLMITVIMIGDISSVKGMCNEQRETFYPTYLFSQTDLTNFVVKTMQPGIYSEITSDEIVIEHNNPVIIDYQGKLIKLEYNLGHASFSNFDIKLNINYNVSLPIYWGGLTVIIGSDYDPNYIVSIDKQLYFAQVNDPWPSIIGKLKVGATPIDSSAESAVIDYDLKSPATITFQIKRTGTSITSKISKESSSLVSHTWDDEVITNCNYIRIQLEYYTEVEAFSFNLSNFIAILDVEGIITSPPISTPPPSSTPSNYSINLPTIDSFSVIAIFAIITAIEIRKRNKGKN